MKWLRDRVIDLVKKARGAGATPTVQADVNNISQNEAKQTASEERMFDLNKRKELNDSSNFELDSDESVGDEPLISEHEEQKSGFEDEDSAQERNIRDSKGKSELSAVQYSEEDEEHEEQKLSVEGEDNAQERNIRDSKGKSELSAIHEDDEDNSFASAYSESDEKKHSFQHDNEPGLREVTSTKPTAPGAFAMSTIDERIVRQVTRFANEFELSQFPGFNDTKFNQDLHNFIKGIYPTGVGINQINSVAKFAANELQFDSELTTKFIQALNNEWKNVASTMPTPKQPITRHPVSVTEQKIEANRELNAGSNAVREINDAFFKKSNVRDVIASGELRHAVKILENSPKFKDLENKVESKQTSHNRATSDEVEAVTSVKKLSSLLDRATKFQKGPVAALNATALSKHLAEMRNNKPLMQNLTAMDNKKPLREEVSVKNYGR